MHRRKRRQDELGPDSAGQSGDIQQLSDVADADSESVEELVEEGNSLEAEAILGVESDRPPGAGTRRELSEDDIPEEYLDDDRST